MALGVEVELYAPLAPPEPASSELLRAAALGRLVLGATAAETVQRFALPRAKTGEVQY